MARRLLTSIATVLAALVVVGHAAAAGGNYVFDGGTQAEQQQVRKALDASSFNWSVVTQRVTIHITRNPASSEAAPGQIWLDANLLDAGQFSWGVVQHEYAHEVDYFLLDDTERATLLPVLGGTAWFSTAAPGLSHASYGCERFASTLAWTYWQSPQNVMKPQSASDESAAMGPAQFKQVVAQLLAQAGPATPSAGAKAPAAGAVRRNR